MPKAKKIVTEVEEIQYQSAAAYVATADFTQGWKVGEETFSVSATNGEPFVVPDGWVRDDEYKKIIELKNKRINGVCFSLPSGASVILPVREA